MAAPVYSAGTVGNLINAVSIAAGGSKDAAAFYDGSTVVETQLTLELITGSTAPSKQTTFNIYKVYAAGSSAPLTFASSASAGATTITLNSAGSLQKGMQFLIQQASGSKLGEVVTVSSIAGAAITLAAGTINAYSTNDLAYYIAQTATFTAAPASSSGSWSASSDYSVAVFLG